jgi:hypothetical protein
MPQYANETGSTAIRGRPLTANDKVATATVAIWTKKPDPLSLRGNFVDYSR